MFTKLCWMSSALLLAGIHDASALAKTSDEQVALEVTKVYRTSMTVNRAHSFVARKQIPVGDLLTLDEHVAQEERQDPSVVVHGAEVHALRVLTVRPDSIELALKSSSKLGWYRVMPDGKAGPVSPVEDRLVVKKEEAIQIVKSVERAQAGGYGVTFQLVWSGITKRSNAVSK